MLLHPVTKSCSVDITHWLITLLCVKCYGRHNWWRSWRIPKQQHISFRRFYQRRNCDRRLCQSKSRLCRKIVILQFCISILEVRTLCLFSNLAIEWNYDLRWLQLLNDYNFILNAESFGTSDKLLSHKLGKYMLVTLTSHCFVEHFNVVFVISTSIWQKKKIRSKIFGN